MINRTRTNKFARKLKAEGKELSKEKELEGGVNIYKDENPEKGIKEVKMRLLGNGRGFFGLRKSKNIAFSISTILGIAAITYGISIRNLPLSLGAFAIYLIIITSLARD